jgi:hypothetical protein
MPAYVVGLHQITDPAKFEEYRTKLDRWLRAMAAVI